MEKAIEAIASFARIAEEFKALRQLAKTPEARDRIDQLMKLNQDTSNAIKRGLLIIEDSIDCDERSA